MSDSTVFDVAFDDAELTAMVIEICCVLYLRGYKEVHLGGLMRLLGVSDETAEEHDDRYFDLDDDFLTRVEDLGIDIVKGSAQDRSSKTLH